LQKIKLYITLLSGLLLLSAGTLLYFLNSFAPDRFGNVVLFYSVLALGGFAASTLLGFEIRKLFGQRELLNNYIAQASRQGVWFSLILVVSLVLVHNNFFSWINALLLVLTFIFFESYLLTKNNHPNE